MKNKRRRTTRTFFQTFVLVLKAKRSGLTQAVSESSAETQRTREKGDK
jgi:hypothetical protein